MILLVDIGNSRSKWSLARGGHLEGPWVLEKDPDALGLEGPRQWHGLAPAAVVAAAVARHHVLTALTQWSQRLWCVTPTVVHSAQYCAGVVNGYGDPSSLGADRWANLLGLRSRIGQSDGIVVDIGTAVTVDALRSDGRHAGGAILPGIAAARDGLRRAVPALPEAGRGEDLPATTTAEGIGAGVIQGTVGAIERVAGVISKKLAERPALYLTGGDASLVRAHLDDRWVHDPLITMRGLLAAWEDGCAG